MDGCTPPRDLYSLKRNRRVLSSPELTNFGLRNDRFCVFTVEPLHFLHLRISMEQIEYAVGYLLITDKKVFLILTNRRRKCCLPVNPGY